MAMIARHLIRRLERKVQVQPPGVADPDASPTEGREFRGWLAKRIGKAVDDDVSEVLEAAAAYRAALDDPCQDPLNVANLRHEMVQAAVDLAASQRMLHRLEAGDIEHYRRLWTLERARLRSIGAA
jgi:hypothetical protein